MSLRSSLSVRAQLASKIRVEARSQEDFAVSEKFAIGVRHSNSKSQPQVGILGQSFTLEKKIKKNMKSNMHKSK